MAADMQGAHRNTPTRDASGWVTPPLLTIGVATYRGRDRIERTLDSLVAQTADPSAFEILVVANGPDDGTAGLVRRRSRAANVRIRTVQTPVAGFAHARNLAIHAAAGKYLTWVDDDDWVSENFVVGMLANAHPERVVLPVFGDVHENRGDVEFDNYINARTLPFTGQTVRFADLPTAASFDAGKVVATAMARTVSYDTTLASGIDVLFWTEVILRNRLSISVPPFDSHAVYYRTMRDGSMSRLVDDRFGEDRLRCITALERLKTGRRLADDAIGALQGGQAVNLGRWLKVRPASRRSTLSSIKQLGVARFPYRVMNRHSAKKLVISYAFPPVLDTSGLVAAKRLLLAGEAYDLVTHSMSGVRQVDPATGVLVDENLGERITIAGKPVSAHVGSITSFCHKAFGRLDDLAQSSGGYPHLYSRAMWPAAHVAAAAYKVKHPETVWTAEFSDPLLINVMGAERFGALPRNAMVGGIDAAVARAGFDSSSDNFYQWLESVTFALADRVVFTNALQRRLMLQHAAHPDLAARVAGVSEVSHHPTLPAQYYSMATCDYPLQPDRVHLGYFGVFYGSRDVADLLDALVALNEQERAGLVLHIFTNKPEEAAPVVQRLGLDGCVRVNGYLSFLEFLNLCTRLDWLVVADARVTESHGLNPYLPSKYADYVGSGTDIWSLVEPGSTMDSLPAAAKTSLGDGDAAVDLLRSIVR